MLASLAPKSALLMVLSMAPRVVRNTSATVCSALVGDGGVVLATGFLGFGVGRAAGLAAGRAAGRFAWENGAGFAWVGLDEMSVSRKARGDLNGEERSFGALGALIGLAGAGVASRAGVLGNALASSLAG